MSPNMTRRHGPVIKTIIVVVVLLCSIYFIYVYNNVSGKLKETERVAERYRREQESLRTQLQDLSAAKDDLQQRFENEKKEFVNRLNTLNQHHKMLKSQHDDLEADYARLQSEREKMKDDVKLQDEQRNQEYMQLKQEKDLEISSLKDQIANLGREKSELDQHVVRLSSQLKESQKENLHYQGSVNFLQQELFTLQEQVKRQQIQLMHYEQAQKDAQSQNRGQGQLPLGGAQHKIPGHIDFNNQDSPAHENVNHGNQVNANPNTGNQSQDHPLVGGNIDNQGSFGHRHGINQGAAVKVNRFNQGSRVRTGNINVLHHGDKMDSRVIDQQQQQHQVQPPNLNQHLQKNEGANGQISNMLPPGGQSLQGEIRQDHQPNADVIDAHQQLHQVVPPGQNFINKDDANYIHHEAADTEKAKMISHQKADLIDAHQQQYQVVPPVGHKAKQDEANQVKTETPKPKKADSNMAAEDMGARADGVPHQVAPPGGDGGKDPNLMVGRRGGVEPQHNLPNPNDVQSVLKVGNEEHQQILPLPADPGKVRAKGEELDSVEKFQQPALPNM